MEFKARQIIQKTATCHCIWFVQPQSGAAGEVDVVFDDMMAPVAGIDRHLISPGN